MDAGAWLRRVGAFAAFAALLGGAPIRAGAEQYGDVTVTIEPFVRAGPSHGYTEHRYRVTNRGASQRKVSLTAPANNFGGAAGTIRKLSRTIDVPPGAASVVALYQPALPMSGNAVAVSIDGKAQKTSVSLNGWYASGYTQISVLASRSIPEGDLRTVLEASIGKSDLVIETAPGTMDEWSGNWLAYTGFEGIVLTERDLESASTAVRLAIERFTKAGGVLVVVDAQASAQQCAEGPTPNLRRCESGFGMRMPSPVTTVAELGADDGTAIANSLRESLQRLRYDASGFTTVLGGQRVPVRGLFIAMVLFALIAGPVNMFLLGRANRRLWILWTLPALAIATSAGVVVYASFSEGWVEVSRTNALTWLDQREKEAVTLGWTEVYATVAPGDGLVFSSETEIEPFGAARENQLDIDWTDGQKLTSGWMTSRMATSFRLRKNEARRERLEFRRNAGGELSVVNGLGAPISSLWVADESGQVFKAEPIAAGASATLVRTSQRAPNAGGGVLRRLFAARVNDVVPGLHSAPLGALEAGRWLAEVEGAPFVEKALRSAKADGDKSIVLGELIVDGGTL